MKRLVFIILTLLCVSGILADGAKYLIIAPDSFVQALQPLADWKTKKGVLAKIVPLSAFAGNTASQIKNYILNAYNNWTIRPEYILLAGHGTVLPYSGNSDDYFADMTGNYQIELSIGRIPCATVSQCQNIIAKTISYERTPYIDDSTWFRKGTTIVKETGGNPPDSAFWGDIRYIHNFWRHDYYMQIDSFSRLRGNNSIDVMNAISNGRIFIVYRGEAIYNWWLPFDLVIPDTLNNGYKLPVIVSGSDQMMSMNDNTYLGNKFLNAGSFTNSKGAVGFFSTTVGGVTIDEVIRGEVVKGFFKAIIEENTYKMGDAAKRAKFIIDSIQPPFYTTTRYHEWQLFGDPELNLWTAVPKPLSVTYDSVINPTPSNVTVTVMTNGIPVRNALVCLMQDTTIYQYGNTDSNGIKVFSISPQDTGIISITVTARNCHPFEGVIRVLPEGIEELSTLNVTSTMFEIYPNPAKSFFIARIPSSIKNQMLKMFDTSGKLVKEIDTPSAHNDKIAEIIVSLKGIKPGVYFVKVGDEMVKEKLVVTR